MLWNFWIILCIFMFLPFNFDISYSLTNVLLLTRTYFFVNCTCCMGISPSHFKQIIKFLCGPCNENTAFVINKRINLFHEAFKKIRFLGSMVHLKYKRFLGSMVHLCVKGNLWLYLSSMFHIWIVALSF